MAQIKLAEKFTEKVVNDSFVIWKGKETLLGQVKGGSFASTAWLEHYPYRTITGRVEVLWADDGMRAATDRNNLTRVANIEELKKHLANEQIKVCETFQRYLEGDSRVKECFVGLFIDED